MKRLLPLLLAFLLSGCFPATPTHAPSEAATAPGATAISTAAPVVAVPTPATPTLTAPAVITPTLAPTVATAAPTTTVTPTAQLMPTAQANAAPTAVAPTAQGNPDAKYELQEERIIGVYAVRLWRNTTTDFPYDNIATISAPGQPETQIENASAFNDLTGQDLTKAGAPTLVVETYTGGAHCCFGTLAFELGATLRKVLDLQTNNCAGRFEDLNGDGVYEFVTCDDLFAYAYCPYAMSPKVRVIFQYNPAKGYGPASPKFVSQYAEELEQHLKMAQNGKPGDMGEFDGSSKCSILPAVLDYLYTGQTAQAWQLFEQYYTAPDAKAFRSEIEQGVYESPLWISP